MLHPWKGIENRLFNPEDAVANYFKNKLFLRDPTFTEVINKREGYQINRDIGSLCGYTIFVLKNLRPYIKEEPNLLKDDKKIEYVAKKITANAIGISTEKS